MPYTKTTWTETTGITPERLNNLETQYDKAMADAVTEAKQEIQYYVSTSGNDNNAGTSGSPFKTIQRAVDVAHKAIAGQVRINIAAGTYPENVDIEDILVPKLFLYGNDETDTIIDGDIAISNAQHVQITDLQMRNSYYGIIASNGLRRLQVSSVIINNASIGISAREVEMVTISSSEIDANAEGIRCETVGTLAVSSTTFSEMSVGAISISGGTFAYTSGLNGSLGTVPVHRVSGSILIKGTSTITGGADTKSSGGQIFE